MNDTWLLAIPFIAIFIGFWCLILWLLSHMGGWARLAHEFAASQPPAGDRFGMQSIRVGWVNYNNCVVIHSSEAGLHIQTWRLFVVAHPPIFLPWSALKKVSQGRVLFWRWVKLEVSTTGRTTTLTLSQKVLAGREGLLSSIH